MSTYQGDEETDVAVSQRKMSRSNTRHRQVRWKATTAQLAPITVDGTSYRVPRRLAQACERGLLRPEG